MLLEILKAFIIGICASAPLGPVAILVLQRTICYGQKAGFATGLGASLVDTAYAIISIFAWAFAQNFITPVGATIHHKDGFHGSAKLLTQAVHRSNQIG